MAPVSEKLELRIFVSSTTLDLEPYRKAACEEIERFGWKAISQEYMGPDQAPTALALSLAKIENLGFFISIVGWRYGTRVPTPEHNATTGGELSITEHELRKAQRLGVACLAFVDVGRPDPKILENDLSLIRNFRDKLDCPRREFENEKEPYTKFRENIRSELERLRSAALEKRGEAVALDYLRLALFARPLQWTLKKKLGTGGLADVFEVEDKNRRVAAVKAYRARAPEARNENARLQFKRGALALERLKPDIASGIVELIEGPFEDRGCLWYVMERVDGPSLRKYLVEKSSLSFDARLHLLIQLGTAIRAAHKNERKDGAIFHGDLTPENILIDGQNRVVVCDFEHAGVALGSTESLHVIDRFAFLPPEARVEGRPVLGAVRDLWALGMLFQFVLVGKAGASRSERAADRTRLKDQNDQRKLEVLALLIEWLLDEEPDSRPEDIEPIVRATAALQRAEFAHALAQIPVRKEANLRDQLIHDAVRWLADPSDGALWKGARLRSALELPDSGSISETVALFLKASQKRRIKRLSQLGGGVASVLIAAGAFGWTKFDEYLREQERIEQAQRERERRLKENIGRFALVFRPFEWNPVRQAARISEMPNLKWRLCEPITDDASPCGDTIIALSKRAPPDQVEQSPGEQAFIVEARGGKAVLEISGRGDKSGCAPAYVPIHALPGFYQPRTEMDAYTIHVPTCSATFAGMQKIPGGEYRTGGWGKEPIPPKFRAPIENVVEHEERDSHLGEFYIQSTEVTVAAFGRFTSMNITQLKMPAYPTTLVKELKEDYPIANVDYATALSFCRFWGLTLPSAQQWDKVARGGIYLDEFKNNKNQAPYRNFPWGTELGSGYANLEEKGNSYAGPAPVKQFPRDLSPYGDIWDLGGNVAEWTSSKANNNDAERFIRGGSWSWEIESWRHAISFPNFRAYDHKNYAVGFRCATPPGP